MKYLDTMLKDGENKEDFEEDLLIIEKELNKLNIHLDDNEEQIFTNHIMCLIRRLNTNNLIDPIEEEMMGEIDQDSFDKATMIVEGLFKKRGIDLDKSEIFLVATHILLNKLRTGGNE